MLSSTRNFAKSPWAIVVIGVIIAAFAFTGVGGIFTGSGTAVAIVGTEQISVNELQGAYNREISNIQQEYPEFTQDQARELGLGDQVLQRLIVLAAFSSKASEMGLAVSEATLLNNAAGIEAFRNPITGRYDFDTMREVLAVNGYTVDQFQAELAGDLLRSQLTAALGTGVSAPAELAQTRLLVGSEERVMRGLFIDATFADAIDAPDDEVLQAYIENNRALTDPQTGLPQFIAPEMRGFTLVRFQVADFIRDVEVDEGPLREFYDYQLETGQIGTPALRTFSQVNVPDEATANAVVARIAAGEAPADIASALELGAPFSQEDVQAYEVPDEALSDVIFATGVGESVAVEGSFGWYAVHITGGVDADIPTYEEQLPALREEAALDQALDAMYEVMGRFGDARDGGATLEDAAAQAGAPLEIFPPLDRIGRDQSLEIDFPRYASLGQDILPLVFEQFEGVDSDLEAFNETDFFVVRVDSVVDEELRPLDDVRDIAESYWRVEQISAQLDTLAEDALAQLQAGEEIDIVALTSGGRVETATLTREQTAGLFTNAVVTQAFDQGVGVYGLVQASTPGVKAIVVVDEVRETDPASADSNLLAGFQSEIDTALSNDVLMSAQNALISEYGLDEGGVDPRLRALALGESDLTGQ